MLDIVAIERVRLDIYIYTHIIVVPDPDRSTMSHKSHEYMATSKSRTGSKQGLPTEVFQAGRPGPRKG